MSTQTLHPVILWAQRSNAYDDEKNIVYFTVDLPNIKGEPELDVQESKITFKATAGAKDAGVEDKSYAFELELFEPIDASLTKKNLTTRHLQLILRKKEAKDEFWPRLTKEKVKNQFIKTDFAKWVDEDEQEEAPAVDDSEFQGGAGGPPGMGGMGGMPGMGGAGGAGGMDMASLMAQMGGGGAGGGEGGMPGGMDFQKLMAQMQAGGAGGAGGMPDMSSMMGGAGGDGDSDEDEDDMPPLEAEDGSKLDSTD